MTPKLLLSAPESPLNATLSVPSADGTRSILQTPAADFSFRNLPPCCGFVHSENDRHCGRVTHFVSRSSSGH